MSNESVGFGSSTEDRRKVVLERLNPVKMKLRHQLGLLGLAGFVLLPTQLYPDQMGPFIQLVYLIMFAMSWDAVSGYTGQLSFGHAFFFAVGGYTSAVLNLQHGVTPLLSIPSGMVLAAVGGIAVGVPALRLRGPYLSLVTLIVPIILAKLFILFSEELIVFGIPIAPGGLGGQSGVGITDPLFGPVSNAVFTVSDYQMGVLSDYYFSLGLMGLVLAVLLAVTRSSAGTVFTAIREDEDAVAAAGLNPAKFKLFAFVLSAAVGGLAGAAYVHTYASPQPLALLGTGNVQMSIDVIIMAILGGTGTIVGAAVGGVFFGVSQAVIGGIDATVPLLNVAVSDLRPLPLLVVAMLVLFYLPGGLLRGGIRGGRFALAYSRGEKDLDDLDLREKFDDTALGQIVGRYRRELRDEMDTVNDRGGKR